MKADFYTEVYNIVKEIPEGNVVTYGQLAKLARRPQCSRMVGQAMFNAPRELNLPCHRVVNSQGRLAPNWTEQRELLEKEGIAFKKNGCVDLFGRRYCPLFKIRHAITKLIIPKKHINAIINIDNKVIILL